jgi:hypothetical protein
MNFTKIVIFFFFENIFFFDFIIIKIDDCEIKHKSNTEMLFLDRDNLIKDKTMYEIEFLINLIYSDEIKKLIKKES